LIAAVIILVLSNRKKDKAKPENSQIRRIIKDMERKGRPVRVSDVEKEINRSAEGENDIVV